MRPNNLYTFWVNLFVYLLYHFRTPVFQHGALIAGPWIVWWCNCLTATHKARTMALQRWVKNRIYPNDKFISYTSWINIVVHFHLHFRTPVFQHGASLVPYKSDPGSNVIIYWWNFFFNWGTHVHISLNLRKYVTNTFVNLSFHLYEYTEHGKTHVHK